MFYGGLRLISLNNFPVAAFGGANAGQFAISTQFPNGTLDGTV